MKATLQVLSDDERARIHERSLEILDNTGMRIDTEKGRRILERAGAQVDENSRRVRFPRALVEESLAAAPRNFTLGARRPGYGIRMNEGDCVLLADGTATDFIDPMKGERRTGTFDDWLKATRLIDTIDEIGVHWPMVIGGEGNGTRGDLVNYWRHLFGNFSKHVQETLDNSDEVPWFLEVLQVIFGDRESIRRQHPVSYLLNPQSPLIMVGKQTDAYLELLDWNIPVAVMPMPMMGATSPASLVSTLILGNCETLGYLCLVQAAAPGTPFIYAPLPVLIDPRSGRFTGSAVEMGLLGAGVTEMGRHYGLPVQAAGTGTDQYFPSIQAGYEKATNGLLTALSWPDILIEPGHLGCNTALCLEQVLIDIEIFRLTKQARRGFVTDEDKWLDDVIEKIGPAGSYLSEKSTREAVRGGEWYISRFGMHDDFELWDAAGRPDLLDQAQQMVEEMLANHQPLPFDEAVERELQKIQESARAA
jgi:trimethylamine--corrinoid protein Co-methyltransferase